MMDARLSLETLEVWQNEFFNNPKNLLAQNAATRFDPFELCISRRKLSDVNHVYSIKVESEGKPVTNQKSSGRCWIFAALNCVRIPFMKQHNLEDFEFSQGYLYFWDKIERSNFYLNNIHRALTQGEKIDGRLISFWLQSPISDGGQWDMIVNLVSKYGLMPKKCFPESFSCEASQKLNAILNSKLREYTKCISDMVSSGLASEIVVDKISQQMRQIYQIIGICLGIPKTSFVWEYYDKTKAYKKVGPILPVKFYEDYVKPYFNVENKVCLVNDPRPSSLYGQIYTVFGLGNVIGGRNVVYNNQPIDDLMNLIVKSLEKGEPVWFGCEVNKRFFGKLGIQDLEIFDFRSMFDTDVQINLSKPDRLIYGESSMTHAMVFTAVSLDDTGCPTKFRVENSWGEDRGEKGYIMMTRDWCKEFLYEIVVDKSVVPENVMKAFEGEPIVLPAWDPMGTLATY